MYEELALEGISCGNCMHCVLQDNDETYYCLELKFEIPEGEDPGHETRCESWIVAPEYSDIEPKAGDGGRRAVTSGRSAEHVIGCLLEERGYKVRYQYVLSQKSIFNTEIKVDVFCQGIPQFRNGLIVESKWQDSSGTAIQKIAYSISNIKQVYPTQTILVIDGKYTKEGAGKNAVDWAKTQTDNKLIHVFTLNEFMTWVIRDI